MFIFVEKKRITIIVSHYVMNIINYNVGKLCAGGTHSM